MSILEKFFNLAGSLICHQLASRSLYADNVVLPVCARDTGIYAGIFTSAFLLLLLRRFKAQKPPGIAISVFMCILMLPMVMDGLLSYGGIIETNNIARLFTGALFGLPIPYFLVPAAHFSIYGVNSREVLKNAYELTLAYAVLIVLCMFLLKSLVPYTAAGLIFISGFLFLLSRLTYTILTRIGRCRQKMLYTVTFCTTLSILILLFLISTFILQPLKSILLGG